MTTHLTAARVLAAEPSLDERRAVELYVAGEATKVIWLKTGIGNTRLRRVLRAAGVERRPRGAPRGKM